MKKLFAFACALIFSTAYVSGQSILTFEFSALAGNEATANSNTNDPNLNSSTISRGAGLTASSNGGRFNATNWATTSIANAIAGDDYMEFTISPLATYEFTVSSIDIQIQRSGTGPREMVLRSSVDGYASNLGAVFVITDNTSTQTHTFTFLQTASTTPVTYRVYGYAETTAGSGGIGDGAGDDIVVNGTVAVSGGPATPTISATPSTLNTFTYAEGSGPSNELSFDVSGTDLTGPITFTVPANFEISTTSGSFTGAPVTFTPVGGVVTPQTVYVRMVAGLTNAGSPYSATLTAASPGTTTPITLEGTVGPAPAPPCSDIFISEYIEGSSNNKYIEIYNPTASAIDLTAGNYSLRLYGNGSLTPTADNAITGSIPAYGTLVLRNGSATIYGGASVVNASLNFNGDDAITIAKNGVDIDIFGVIGEDPGSAWTFGGNTTVNQTLIRNANNNSGVNSNPATFAALGTDWTQFAIDDISNLGGHTSDCFVPTTPLVSLSIASGTASEGGPTAVSLTATADAPVTGDQTVTITLSGSGVTNADFTGATFPATITILNGNTTGSLNFNVNDDALVEGLETATFEITASSAGLTLGFPLTADLAITDNDAAPACSQLFISQYHEGTGNEKFIEIYNPTASPISWAGYRMAIYNNGSATVSNTFLPSGTIPAYGTFVIANTSATIFTGDVTNGTVMGFNGNDAIALQTAAGVNIDVVGEIGNSATFASDVTLVRNATVQSPTTTYDPLEWTSTPANDVSDMGIHTSDCFVPTTPTVSLSIDQTLLTEGSATTITLTATASAVLASTETVTISLSGASNADFTGAFPPAIITINSGSDVGTLSFTLTDDVIPEGTEVATFTISGTSAGLTAIPPTSVTLTIDDNDSPDIVIYEIMYNNAGADEEWIELFNNSPVNITLDNTWTLSNTNASWSYNFPNFVFPAGAAITIQVGSSGAFPFTPDIVFSSAANQLTNSSSTITLMQGANVIDEVTYADAAPWPTEADGNGPSLSLISPTLDNSIGSNWTACVVDGTPNAGNTVCASNIYYTVSSGLIEDAIWSPTPNGPAILAQFDTDVDLVIQAGHTVELDNGGSIPVRNLTINFAGRLWRNSNIAGSMRYMDVYGNITNNGVIGNGNTFDAIGFNIEGPSTIFSGTGITNLGRIRKNSNASAISDLTINHNINLRFPGTCIYNDAFGTRFNLTLASGRTVNVIGDGVTAGDLAVDGANGIGPAQTAGVYTINGNLNVSGTIYALSNNVDVLFVPGMTINASGRVTTNNLDMRRDGGADVGFNMNIVAGGQLRVNGLMTQREGNFVTNGGLVLGPNATLLHGVGTPGLAPDPGGSVTGTVRVLRKGTEVPGKYNYWSSPVSGSTLFSIMANGLSSGSGSNTYEYMPSNATGTDAVGLREGWEQKTSGQIMEVAKGYITTSGGEARFTGPVNTGSITEPLIGGTFTRFNLVGNPYPSPINAQDFLALNGPAGTNQIAAALYFWDDDGSAGAGYDVNDYVVTNTLGTSTVQNGNGSGVFTGSIASGQGFFVESTVTGTQVEFTNSMRNSNSTFFFEATEMSRMWLKVSNPEGHHNETLLAFLDGATDNVDAVYDAKKLMGNEHLAVFTPNGNEQFAIQAWPTLNEDKVIPVGVNANINGVHTFSIAHIDNVDPTVLIYLEDRMNNTFHNLRSSDYHFNVTEELNGAGRFFLHFSKPVSINANAESCNTHDGSLSISDANSWDYSVVNYENVEVASGSASNYEVIEGLSAGNYVVNLTTDDGYLATLAFEIEAAELVNIQIEDVEDVEANTSITLTAQLSGAEEIIWNFGDGIIVSGTNSITHEYAQAGLYNVTATASNGECSSQASIEVRVIDLSTGLSELNSNNIQIFPNPASDYVSIKAANASLIEITDLTGKVIISKTPTLAELQVISLKEMTSGVYLVRVTEDNKSLTYKLVVGN